MNKRMNDFQKFSKMCRTWSAVKPKAAVNEILIYGPIVDVAWWEDEVTTMSVLQKLEDMKDAEEISVRINSPGGFAFEGIAIYNALRKHPAKVNVSIDALAASAASIIAMAGDRIKMAGNATMMVHDPWALVIGSAEDLLKEAEVLETITAGMVKTYSSRTGQEDDVVRQMMKDETWFTAEQAKEKGFADEIEELKEKPESSVDLSVFSNVPGWVKAQYRMEAPPTKPENQADPRHMDSLKRRMRLEEAELY